MARSFQIVESKIAETEFFLNQIRLANNIVIANYYFNAFLSAGRSMTFALQKSLNGVEGFDEWYEKKQEMLKNNEVALFMKNARNKTEHEGASHIIGGGDAKDAKGNGIVRYYFDVKSAIYALVGRGVNDGIEDVYASCKNYFLILLELIYDCFQSFGTIIDPMQYYTLENLRKIGTSIEDIENELGFPRGWTDGIPDEERLNLLKRQIPDTEIDAYFIKYLGKDRFGEKHI